MLWIRYIRKDITLFEYIFSVSTSHMRLELIKIIEAL